MNIFITYRLIEILIHTLQLYIGINYKIYEENYLRKLSMIEISFA